MENQVASIDMFQSIAVAAVLVAIAIGIVCLLSWLISIP